MIALLLLAPRFHGGSITLNRSKYRRDQIVEPLLFAIGKCPADAFGRIVLVELQSELPGRHKVKFWDKGRSPWPMADAAISKRAFSFVFGLLLELSCRDGMRDLFELFFDHKADRLLVGEYRETLVGAVGLPPAILDCCDETVQYGASAFAGARRNEKTKLVRTADCDAVKTA